jgi:hypothetical protein
MEITLIPILNQNYGVFIKIVILFICLYVVLEVCSHLLCAFGKWHLNKIKFTGCTVHSEKGIPAAMKEETGF